MNSCSPEDVATQLGTSRRRVTRAARVVGVGDVQGRRVRFSEEDVETLARRLGVSPPVPGLSRTESRVLAELSRRPNGLVSARAVARACSLAPAAASGAVQAIVERGLVRETKKTVALGRAREVTMLTANVEHPQWDMLLERLRHVRSPTPQDPDGRGLPAHLRHAFWNVDGDTYGDLDLRADGPFIASRAITTGDPALMAFAASRLDPAAWQPVVDLRGLTSEQRQTARNLAGSSVA